LRFSLGIFIVLTTSSAFPAMSGNCDVGKPPYFAALFGDLPSSSLDDTGGSESVSASERQGLLGLYRFGNSEVCVDLALDYQYTHFEYEGLQSRDRDLHRLQLPLSFATTAGDWRIRGVIAPGISTSSNVFKDFLNRGSSDDLLLAGRVEFLTGAGNRQYLLGLAHDRSFGRPGFYPIAGVMFEPGDRLRLRLAYPDPGLAYRLGERQQITARVFPAGHQWHVVADDFATDFDYRVEALRSQLTWSIPIGKRLAIDLSGGYESGRRHVLTDDLGNRIDTTVADEWLVAIGFRIGPAPHIYTNGTTFPSLPGGLP
jgi:hypothetical protein